MTRGETQRKIFDQIAKYPPICIEISVIDVFYLCRGLTLWLEKYPNTQSIRKLFLKLRTNLTAKFPKLAKDILYLLPEIKD
ncbi:MAG: hypothetical protein AAGJ08_01780 [Cyanobacteria bacterium P01_H01_bin.35]